MKNTRSSSKWAVWKLHVTHTNNSTYLRGTICQNTAVIQGSDSATENALKIIKSYFIKKFYGKILAKCNQSTVEIQTNKRGHFFKRIPLSPEGKIKFQLNEETLPILQKYPVEFDHRTSDKILISDIDDTILVSKNRNQFSKIRQLLTKSPAQRNEVKETASAFALLSTLNINFLYLSRSETNLFHLISLFFSAHNVPEGPIYLRHFHSWKNLIFKRKEKDYKTSVLEQLSSIYPDNKFILFGDDSQMDLKIFSDYVKKYPEKVEAIYIRKTGYKVTSEINGLLQSHSIFNVPFHYYSSFKAIEENLKQHQ